MLQVDSTGRTKLANVTAPKKKKKRNRMECKIRTLSNTYRIPNMRDLFPYRNIFRIPIAVPILPAFIDLSAVWTFYSVSRPGAHSQTVPALFLLLRFMYLHFVPIFVTFSAYVHHIVELSLISAPVAMNIVAINTVRQREMKVLRTLSECSIQMLENKRVR